MTWNLILKFVSLLILVVEALYLMNPTDATLVSLSVSKYSRWRPNINFNLCKIVIRHMRRAYLYVMTSVSNWMVL